MSLEQFIVELGADWPYVDGSIAFQHGIWRIEVTCTGRRGYYGKTLECRGSTYAEALERLTAGFAVVPTVPVLAVEGS